MPTRVIDRYAWRGGSEAVLRFGPASGPVVIVAAPLFEEANRTRAWLVAICRGLAERGIASALPDLPGTGESLVETRDARLADWREAFAAVAASIPNRPIWIVAVRSGALLDVHARARGRYHIAPTDGARLVRELLRTRQAAAREGGERFDPAAIEPPGPPIEIAGNALARELLADLQTAVPVAADRTVRLASDALPADLTIDAAPIWRQAEPQQDQVFADQLAEDIASWILSCAG